MLDSAEIIKTLRKEVGMTQKRLSEKAGYNVNTIKHIETGRRIGNWETINNMIEALGYEVRIVKNGCN